MGLSDYFVEGDITARGCGMKDAPAIQTCGISDSGYTLCQCAEDKCNNVTNTAKLMEYATSTTTTTTTTTTTVTTTTTTTTTTTVITTTTTVIDVADANANSGRVVNGILFE